MLIYYLNGQRKPWYKRTERPYRFRRWFLRGSTGTFSNLANISEPRITVYVFRYYICFPKKVVIPMRIVRMDIKHQRIGTQLAQVHPSLEKLRLHDLNFREKAAALEVSSLDIHPELPLLHVQLSGLLLQTECAWPVASWIEKGILTPDNLHLLNHPEKLPTYA